MRIWRLACNASVMCFVLYVSRKIVPTPKQRHTKSRRNRRRSHHALKKQAIFVCPKCGQPVLPHQVCPNCGFYNGREIIDTLKKLTKKERKQKELEMQKHEKEQTKRGKSVNMEDLSKKI